MISENWHFPRVYIEVINAKYQLELRNCVLNISVDSQLSASKLSIVLINIIRNCLIEIRLSPTVQLIGSSSNEYFINWI